MNNVIDLPELIPGLPAHQDLFDEILGHYSSGIEPLESWTTEDLVRLSRALDAELQIRYDKDNQDATHFYRDE
jgi:hypothetical protein